MANGFLYIPFWRAGGWDDNTYRTQLYFAPLSQGPVRLGIFLYENGGRPWVGKTFDYEIDQHVDRVTTNRDGMLDVNVGPNQIIRLEINVTDHEYGTGRGTFAWRECLCPDHGARRSGSLCRRTKWL